MLTFSTNSIRGRFDKMPMATVTLSLIAGIVISHNFAVSNVKDLSGILDAAFEIASSGRPGPVLVDIPKSIQTDMCDEADFVVQEVFYNDLPETDVTEAVKIRLYPTDEQKKKINQNIGNRGFIWNKMLGKNQI